MKSPEGVPGSFTHRRRQYAAVDRPGDLNGGPAGVSEGGRCARFGCVVPVSVGHCRWFSCCVTVKGVDEILVNASAGWDTGGGAADTLDQVDMWMFAVAMPDLGELAESVRLSAVWCGVGTVRFLRRRPALGFPGDSVVSQFDSCKVQRW